MKLGPLVPSEVFPAAPVLTEILRRVEDYLSKLGDAWIPVRAVYGVDVVVNVLQLDGFVDVVVGHCLEEMAHCSSA